ncbi:hypothetical protein ACWENQ_36865 [Nonomuraea sp. NPDC004354]
MRRALLILGDRGLVGAGGTLVVPALSVLAYEYGRPLPLKGRRQGRWRRRPVATEGAGGDGGVRGAARGGRPGRAAARYWPRAVTAALPVAAALVGAALAMIARTRQATTAWRVEDVTCRAGS